MTSSRIRIVHPLEPLVFPESRVLILGTMPSPRSREAGCYYAHPQNRFWRVMAALWHEPVPISWEERARLVRRHRLALWDVLRSCTIAGADDGSIRDPVPNDLNQVLERAEIRAIFTTGSKAAALYRRYAFPVVGRPAFPLPSTSSANCRYHTEETLVEAYRAILPYTEEDLENVVYAADRTLRPGQ